MRVFSVIIFISFIAISLNSATWQRTYGGTGIDAGYSVIQDSEGYYVVAGYTESFGAGGRDIWVLKVDSVGDTVWAKTYGGVGDDVAYDMHETSDSCYVLCGYRDDLISYIFKINQEGEIQWEKTYPSFNKALSFDITFDKGFILASNSYILKLDSSGDSTWCYYVDGNYEVKSVIQTSDSGYILTANEFESTRIIKFDSNISVEWDTTYHSYLLGCANKIIQVADFEYVFIARYYLIMIGEFGTLCKIDSVGNIIWTTYYLYNIDVWSLDSYEDFCLTPDSNFLIAGYHRTDPGSYKSNCFIEKFLSDSTFLYQKIFAYSDTSRFYSINSTEDSGYIITGINNFNLYLVKTDSLGDVGVEEEIPGDIPSSDIFKIIDLGNGQVSFNFTLPYSSNIKLEIFDISGRLVTIPISRELAPGSHEIPFRPERNGIYFYRLESPYLNETGKFTVLR